MTGISKIILPINSSRLAFLLLDNNLNFDIKLSISGRHPQSLNSLSLSPAPEEGLPGNHGD